MRPKGAERTLLVGPRIHSAATGVRVGFEMLADEFARRGLPHTVVDLGAGGASRQAGTPHPHRMLVSALALISFWFQLLRARQVYITIASSRLGFLRDA